MLAVTDTGTGMDADTRARIFEPFFTTKSPDKGTGLGLATVYGIVKQSAGEIFVYSELGLGTSFKIFLPRSTEVSEARDIAEAGPREMQGSETVLVAEDESVIRTIIKRSLEKAGYTVLLAENGDAAMRILESHASPIHLLLTDMIMPGMSGSDLAQRARARHPGLRVLFLSGYTRATATGNGILPGDAFLQKPFGTETLVATAREVLDAVP
jgi:CheY-like chemotaxis protein